MRVKELGRVSPHIAAQIAQQVGKDANQFGELTGKRTASKSKHGNIKCEYNGMVFDSRVERDRYIELSIMQAQGAISELSRSVEYELIPPLVIDGKKTVATRYIADLVYRINGQVVVEDVKGGKATAEFAIKRKLMKHVHGIDVKIWRPDGNSNLNAKPKKPFMKRGRR